MTVLMTFIGTFVFVFSWPKAGFASAFRRLLAFAAAGMLIDLMIITVSLLVTGAVSL